MPANFFKAKPHTRFAGNGRCRASSARRLHLLKKSSRRNSKALKAGVPAFTGARRALAIKHSSRTGGSGGGGWQLQGHEQPDEASCYRLLGASLWQAVCGGNTSLGKADANLSCIWEPETRTVACAPPDGAWSTDAALIVAAATVLPRCAATDSTSLAPEGSDADQLAIAAATADNYEEDVRHARRFDRWAARRAMLGAGDDDDDEL